MKTILILLIPFILFSQTIIADHTIVDDYDIIPQQYLDSVKTMLLLYGGESHSGAIPYGCESLRASDSKFPVVTTWTGAPAAITDTALRISKTIRNLTNTGWLRGVGEQTFYTNQAAITALQVTFGYYKTTISNPIDVMCFGWCWDMTWHNACTATQDAVYEVGWAGSSVSGPQGDLPWGLDAADSLITGNSVCMDDYLAAVETYNAYDETDFVVFFSTGPVDNVAGSDEAYQRYIKHEYIRDYVDANGGYLFDYADILCYNNSGVAATTTWNGHTFPHIHTDNTGNYDGGYGACHIGEVGCIRLAKAMWWILARKAGWDGQAEQQTQTGISIKIRKIGNVTY